MSQPESLRAYLVRTWSKDGDLHALATLSGVQLNSLIAIDAGHALPSADHLAAIRRVIDIPDEVLMRHRRPEPAMRRTRRGTVPEGYQLMMLTVPEIAVGDLVVIQQPTSVARGNNWATVESVQNQGHVYVVDVGGVLTRLGADSQLRVARRIS